MYKTIDLCAGIGGIRCGFEMTGLFKNVLSAEIDPAACRTYKYLFKQDPTNDLTSLEFKKIAASTEYDVLLAGFPCQTFSSVGQKKGFDDCTKGTIFFDIEQIINNSKPKAIFLENVENLILHDGGNTIDRIVRTLEDTLGYHIVGLEKGKNRNYKSAFVRNSKNFGVPQNRPRVYIMAFKDDLANGKLNSLNFRIPEKGDKLIYSDLDEVLEQDVDDKYYIAEGYLETLKRHKERQKSKGNGFGYCVLNAEGIEHPLAHTIMATGGSGKERNLICQYKDGVAGKIIPGKHTPLNSEGIRFMTPTEWARLQGFAGYGFIDEDGKDNFGFPEGMPDGQKYKQLGNSVTIPVINTMAKFMAECLDKLEKEW